jgi:hypothetical protein
MEEETTREIPLRRNYSSFIMNFTERVKEGCKGRAGLFLSPG